MTRKGLGPLFGYGAVVAAALTLYALSIPRGPASWLSSGNDLNERGRALKDVRKQLVIGIPRNQVIDILGYPDATSVGESGYWDEAKRTLGKRLADGDTVLTYFVYVELAAWYEDVIPQRFDIVLDKGGYLKIVMTDREIDENSLH